MTCSPHRIAAHALLLFPLSVLLAGLLGCGDDGAGAECRLNSDCARGFTCDDGRCLRECRESRDCPADLVCTARGCEPGADPPPGRSGPESRVPTGPAETGGSLPPDPTADRTGAPSVPTDPTPTDCDAIIGTTCLGNNVVQQLACGGTGEVEETCDAFSRCDKGVCERERCPDPPVPEYGAASFTSTEAGATVEYTCDEGYLPAGRTTLVCSVDGDWDGSPPACEPAPPLLGNPCSRDSDCADGAWCPPAPALRRCAPHPEPSGVDLPMLYIPAGSFTMGSPTSENGRVGWKEGQVPVTLTRPFFLQRTETTQAQWRALSGGANPSCFQSAAATLSDCSQSTAHGDHPVEQVSWWSAVAFTNALSEAMGVPPCYTLPSAGCTGSWQDGTLACEQDDISTLVRGGDVHACRGFRLPTEAEWEFAARAGAVTATPLGELEGEVLNSCSTPPQPFQPALDPIAWYCRNTDEHTERTGQLPANAWGLHDMLGNVEEWVWDRFGAEHVGGTDPVRDDGPRAVARGGSWIQAPFRVRSATRLDLRPEGRLSIYGLRVAQSLY